VRRVLETNFFGILALTRALLPTFRGQGNGRIAVVSGDAAFFGQPANSMYCASKWAIDGWAEAVAYELAPFGIDVVLIEPGPYRTPIWQNSLRLIPPRSTYPPKEIAVVMATALEARRPRFGTSLVRLLASTICCEAKFQFGWREKKWNGIWEFEAPPSAGARSMAC
jgi:NAD(P)-dependent dehydrogenase (short-subunit alcohol dehydrogenase family)